MRTLLLDEGNECGIGKERGLCLGEHNRGLEDEGAVILFVDQVPVVPAELAQAGATPAVEFDHGMLVRRLGYHFILISDLVHSVPGITGST